MSMRQTDRQTLGMSYDWTVLVYNENILVDWFKINRLNGDGPSAVFELLLFSHAANIVDNTVS